MSITISQVIVFLDTELIPCKRWIPETAACNLGKELVSNTLQKLKIQFDGIIFLM